MSYIHIYLKKIPFAWWSAKRLHAIEWNQSKIKIAGLKSKGRTEASYETNDGAQRASFESVCYRVFIEGRVTGYRLPGSVSGVSVGSEASAFHKRFHQTQSARALLPGDPSFCAWPAHVLHSG
jgi:hypothetical protein